MTPSAPSGGKEEATRPPSPPTLASSAAASAPATLASFATTATLARRGGLLLRVLEQAHQINRRRADLRPAHPFDAFPERVDHFIFREFAHVGPAPLIDVRAAQFIGRRRHALVDQRVDVGRGQSIGRRVGRCISQNAERVSIGVLDDRVSTKGLGHVPADAAGHAVARAPQRVFHARVQDIVEALLHDICILFGVGKTILQTQWDLI